MDYVDHCFFCNPEKDRVLYRSENFYVLLGLGPITEGYALLVARKHIRSMFDLPEEMREAYKEEKKKLKNLINSVYGPSIVTEHGRVLACTIEDEEAHDLLCYHAHQLFFPIDNYHYLSKISESMSQLSIEAPFEKVFTGSSLFEMAPSSLREDEEYLLFENTGGQVFIHKVRGKCPRQYMRYLVACSVGQPELRDWARYPGIELIKQAKEKYKGYISLHQLESTEPIFV